MSLFGVVKESRQRKVSWKTKKRRMKTDPWGHGKKNPCCFLSFWKNTRENLQPAVRDFLFVPFVPDLKKTKQMMKIKYPRVVFQNRGQRGQIRRLLFVFKMPVFPLFTGFPAFFFCVFKQGTAGTKKGGGDKNLSLFRLFRCPYTRPLFIFIVPFICLAACKCSSISVFPQKKQALKACGWKNGQQKKAGWLPACKNCLGRLRRRQKKHIMRLFFLPGIQPGIIPAVCSAG